MKRRDENKVVLIYQATLALVNEMGLSGITMSNIAKRAGLATGTAYIYFTDKDELINNLYLRCRQSSAKFFFHDYQPAGSFQARFKKIFFNIARYRIGHFSETIFMDQAYHSPFITEKNKLLSRKFFTPLFELFDRGKKERLIKNSDTIWLITFMFGCINELIKYHMYNNKKISDKAIESAYAMCRGGLAR